MSEFTYKDAVKIRPRRGTKSQWEAKNPVLLEGELAYEYPNEGITTGNVRFKVGDGISRWTDLPYCIDPSVATSIVAGDPNSENLISIKFGSTEQWMEHDPVLAEGECVYDSTMGEMKVGDGIHHFSELKYIGQYWDRNNIYDFGNYDVDDDL